MFELYKRYTLTAAKGTISDVGIALILALITRQNLQSDDWKALNPDIKVSYLPPLPTAWEWVWVVSAKGEYTGKITRRVEKFYHSQGVKCPAAFITEIGNLARAHSAEDVTYRFEFVDEFEWESGDYGDGGSCYWDSHASAREMLVENGANAILFYNEAGEGIGRAWLVLWQSIYIIFNGYGFAGDATLKIASIFAAFIGGTYRKISLLNNGSYNDTLWINGAGTGYAVGAPELVNTMDKHVDLGWAEIHHITCYDCGDGVSEDETYYGADGETYCQNCFYDRFDYCERCGDTYYRDDITATRDGRYLCGDCLNRDYTLCDDCGEYVRDTDTYSTDDGVYCENCYTPPDEESEDE